MLTGLAFNSLQIPCEIVQYEYELIIATLAESASVAIASVILYRLAIAMQKQQNFYNESKHQNQ